MCYTYGNRMHLYITDILICTLHQKLQCRPRRTYAWVQINNLSKTIGSSSAWKSQLQPRWQFWNASRNKKKSCEVFAHFTIACELTRNHLLEDAATWLLWQ